MTNFKVEFFNPDEIVVDEDGVEDHTPAQASVVVKGVEYKDYHGWFVSLRGTDPSCYPEWLQDSTDTHRWFSKGPTLYMDQDDPVEVLSVSPTDEPVPKPDTQF